jgi:hypothetical protein
MTEAEETVDDLNIKKLIQLPDEAKTVVDLNISAEHNRLQNTFKCHDA